MKYTTTLPVMTRVGPSKIIDEEELQESSHPEVRLGALSGRTFVFGGVTFMPDVEAPKYTGKLRILTEMRGFPLTDSQKAAVSLSNTTRAKLGVSSAPTPALGISIDWAKRATCLEDISDMPTLELRRPVAKPQLALLACVIFSLSVGAGWLAARMTKSEPAFAVPVTDPRADEEHP